MRTIYNHPNLRNLQVMSITELLDIRYSLFIKWQSKDTIKQHVQYNKIYGLQLIILKALNMIQPIQPTYKQIKNNLII